MFMRRVFDEKLAQSAYLIGCQQTGDAIVVDPERDVDRYIDLARENDLRIVAVAETHIHADFLSGARELAEQIGATVYVPDEGNAEWKYEWLDRKEGGGSYEHRLLHHGDTFSIGNIDFDVLHTPGHTPEHICYLVTDRGGGATEPMGLLSGDFVFVGDLGRPDLLETAAGQTGEMEPSARRLYESTKVLGTLPEYVQIWPAHGAGSACGKALGAVPTSTVGYELRFSPALRSASSERSFIDFILSGQPEPPLYFANMKRLNKQGPAVLEGVPRPPRLNEDELLDVDGRESAIIDTRSWEAFREGHVPLSLSIPLDRAFNTNAGSFVRDTEDIYLLVDPERVEEAVRDLIRIGLDRIRGWYSTRNLHAGDREKLGLVTSREMTADELVEALGREDLRVLDVRRATEFAGEHIPGAINVAHTRLASRLDEVPAKKHLVVNCRTGERSACATSYLERLGYDAANLTGGIVAWEEHGAHRSNTDYGR